MSHYKICGLAVVSELDLPLPPAPPSPSPDVFIRRAAVAPSLPDATRTGPTWQVAGRQFLLWVPGIVRFLMTDGREIAFEPEAGKSDDDLRIFLLSSALGALLHQRAGLILHAAAVAVEGEAILFCGPSGAGKSTLVAALARAGYPLIADDVCVIESDESSRPVVASDGRRLKLWADAIEGLAFAARRDASVRPGIEKYWVDPPLAARAETIPVTAVYFLREDRTRGRTAIEALSRIDGLRMLREHAYRPRLIGLLGQEESWLDRSLALSLNSRIFLFVRPREFAALPSGIAYLENHWRTLRL